MGYLLYRFFMFIAFMLAGWLLSLGICYVFPVEEDNYVEQYCMALAMAVYAGLIIWERVQEYKSRV